MPNFKFIKSLRKKWEKQRLLNQFLKAEPIPKKAGTTYKKMTAQEERTILEQVTRQTKQNDSDALIKHVISFSPRVRETTVRSLRIILHDLPNEKLEVLVVPLREARNLLCGGHNLAIRNEIGILLESIKERLGKPV